MTKATIMSAMVPGMPKSKVSSECIFPESISLLCYDQSMDS
eukprot:CAMPEP_0185597642 /NCGR_PEP_ID=MMETSP0434-20130131/81494_1 /TAXON_ID=626734 ORGANISM="Favella taraikaensis, Strain Fe Narragansett Bay" /NCGR_SAMPLE_ID=MMETSP0434 /ASSEMBLY_ACC=CAM_ASM_000379 /LENGTH=40 /DNA_ID= /DNA_START= /DNA_END= /DNA_ORIENTATION=